MNHYPHHIGDFNTATRHLSRLERGMYRDMLDMYYDTETALDGTDFAKLARRLMCVTPEEVAALQFVLEEFFEHQDDGHWLHRRCERELASFRAQQVVNGVVKSNENDRKTRSRARRSAIFIALRAAGIVPKFDTKMAELYRMCNEHGVPIPGDALVPSHVTGPAVTSHAHVTGNQNQNQNHINTPPTPPPGGASESVRQTQAQPPSPHPVEAGHADARQGQGSSTAMATAVTLSGFFPERRRTRLAEAADVIAALLEAGTVTAGALLDAASRQASQLAREEGKACPSMLRWLREQRWLDSPPPAPKPLPAPAPAPCTPEQLAANRARADEAVARIRGAAPQRQAA